MFRPNEVFVFQLPHEMRVRLPVLTGMTMAHLGRNGSSRALSSARASM
jgi:hypothetical protein